MCIRFHKLLQLWPMLLMLLFLLFALCVNEDSVAFAQATKTNAPKAKKESRAAASSDSATLLSILDLKVQGAEKELEDRARKLLSSQVDTPYSLYVKINIDEKLFDSKLAALGSDSRMKTLSLDNNVTAVRYVRNMAMEDIFALIKSVKVSLTIDSSISKTQEVSLQKAIFGALRLKVSRGDLVELEKADMLSSSMRNRQESFDREKQSVSMENKKLELMIKELELQNKALTAKSSEDNKGDSELLSAELKKIASDLQELKEKPNQPSVTEPDPRYGGPLGSIKKIIAGLEIPLTLLPLGLILAVILLKVAGGQGRTALALRGGLEELGKSVQAMADTLATAAKSVSNEAASKTNEVAAQKESQQSDDGGAVEGGALELLQVDAMKTWQLLSGMPYFLLSVFKDWLADPESRERFLQVTEAIGAENASWIWSKFPAEEIEQLGPLLNKQISKVASFGAVSLLYRATVREAGTKPLFAKEIEDLEILISLTDTRLAQALKVADDATVGSILGFLTPARAARVMSLMAERLTIEVLVGIEGLRSAPVQTVKSQIMEFRKVQETAAASLGASSLLACLVKVLETQNHGAKAVAKSYLSNNAVLAGEVRKRVITFDDIMALDSDTLYDLFGALSPTDAAALCSTLEDHQSKLVLSFFGGKAKVQVDEEIRRILSKKKFKKQAEVSADRMKASVVRRVRTMRDQGLLDFDVSESADTAKEAQKANDGNIAQGRQAS